MDTTSQTNGVSHSPLPPQAQDRLRLNKKRSKASRPKAGRLQVMRGERPPIRDAIQLVLGRRVMRSRMIADELIKRGWGPVSSNPYQHISVVLSQNRKHFEPLKPRGVYRVRPGAPRVKPAIVKRFPVGPVKTDVQGMQQCSICQRYGHNARNHNDRKHVKTNTNWQKLAEKAGWVAPTTRKLCLTVILHPTATPTEIKKFITRLQKAALKAVRHPVIDMRLEGVPS